MLGNPALAKIIDVGDAVHSAIQPTFLSGVKCPCFTAVKESAQRKSLVDSHIYVGGEHFVVQHSLCQAGHCCRCLSDPGFQLCIKGEVAGDGGSEVHELVNQLKGVVADGYLGSTADALAHNLGLFQADGEAKLCASF